MYTLTSNIRRFYQSALMLVAVLSFQESISTTDSGGMVFVCLTGQISRLELDSKVENVFKPLLRIMRYIDVALVLDLSPSTSKYTNQVVDALYGVKFTDIDSAALHLSAHLSTGMVNITSFPYTQAAHPIVNKDYIEQLDKNDLLPMQRQSGAENLIRQVEANMHCYMAMTEMQSLHNAYQFSLRLREDVVLPRPLDFDSLIPQLQMYTIVTSGCATWGGINDKGAFVHPSAAQVYYTAPFVDYYVESLNETVRNPETYISSVYYRHQLNVVQDRSLLLLTSRIKKGGVVCTHFVERCERNAAMKMKDVMAPCGRKYKRHGVG